MRLGIIIALLVMAIISSGCGMSRSIKEHTSMDRIYRNAEKQGNIDTATAIAQQLKIHRALGYVKPYVPVINPPVVKRAWIVPHETKGGALVGGYWVYVIVKKPSWYIHTPEENMPSIVIPYAIKNTNKKKEKK